MMDFIKQERRRGERRRAQSERWTHLLAGALVEDRRKSDRRGTTFDSNDVPGDDAPERG
jgi:hypothetical protein